MVSANQKHTPGMSDLLFRYIIFSYAPKGSPLWIMPEPGRAIMGATKNILKRGTVECRKII
jgi:hypothetical protein